MIFKYWQIILGGVIAIPIVFWLGTIYGAKNERTEIENAQIIANANKAINTVSSVEKVRTEYKPVYIEVEKHDSPAPNCPVPSVISDTIKLLP